MEKGLRVRGDLNKKYSIEYVSLNKEFHSKKQY